MTPRNHFLHRHIFLGRKSDIAWIKPSSETNFIFSKIIEKTNYINKFYNFDVVGITEPIQFTSYDGSGNEHYGWHLDMDGGFQSRRKISIVIQLSDENEYEGGELQIDTCTLDGQLTVGNKKRGSMIFFCPPPVFFPRCIHEHEDPRHWRGLRERSR